MVHQPLGGISGQAEDIKIHADHILKTREKLNKILAQATGRTMEQISGDTQYRRLRKALRRNEKGASFRSQLVDSIYFLIYTFITCRFQKFLFFSHIIIVE